MRKLCVISAVFLISLLLLLAPASAAVDPETAASQVAVTSVAVEPQVFMHGDTGTVTVMVTNTGTDFVPLSLARLYSTDLTVRDQSNYNSIGALGGGTSLTFTFTVVADAPDDIYYPKFYLDFTQSGSLRYLIPISVESTDLGISVVEKPDPFVQGKKDTVTLQIGNPRDNTVTGVSVTPVGTGFETAQSGVFIGSLAPDAATNVSFDITPTEEGMLTFHVSYKNGINEHIRDLSLPIVFGEDKKGAVPVLNNIVVASESGYIRVTGDVTNAGLESAKSVTITSGDPAVPVVPYMSYVVGALDADDFSGFEVTFITEGAEEVPLIVSYKDDDGNSYQKTIPLDVGGYNSGGSQPSGADEGMSPVLIALIVVVLAAVGGAIFYSWKQRS